MYKDVLQAIYNELELLNGNLNRMTITDSKEELQDMFGFAVNRLVTLRSLNMQRQLEKRMESRK